MEEVFNTHNEALTRPIYASSSNQEATYSRIRLLNTDFTPRFARILLDTEAVQINTEKPYTWTSGKTFPIYCDNRRLLAYPDLRKEIKRALIKGLQKHFPTLKAVAAVATAGIPYGMLIADELGLPFGYVRPEAKKHGLRKQIEGDIKPHQPLVLVEDHVSTGSSSLTAAAALQQAQHNLLGIVALFSYGLPRQTQALAAANMRLYVLCRYKDLLEVAKQTQHLSSEEFLSLSKIFDKA